MPTSEHGAVAAFEALLDAELQAARQADVDGLLQLQDQKKALTAALRAQPPAPDVLRALTQRSQDNIALMRHLVLCLRGIVEAEGTEAPVTYGAAGTRRSQGPSLLRGAL